MASWVQAGFWGFTAAVALLIGAGLGYFINVPRRLIAAIMAFGSGVLISALSFNLMQEAFLEGGFDSTAFGFLMGAFIYTAANQALARYGAKHRKRSGEQQLKERKQEEHQEGEDNGLALALGALLDGIPESIVIGVSLLGESRVSLIAVAAFFLSNLPEGLSSASGMKRAGRSILYVFGVWGGVVVLSTLAAIVGYTLFDGFSNEVLAGVIAIAAGATLAMIADTMLPEAFEYTHNYTGLITVVGFLLSFVLSKRLEL